MSLAIQPENVRGILLADGWYSVDPGEFVIDAYEYTAEDDEVLYGDGVGFRCVAHKARDGDRDGFPEVLSGPLRSILAVREARDAYRDEEDES